MVGARKVMRSLESNVCGYLSLNAGHTKSVYFNYNYTQLNAKPNDLQFQLILRDYFKDYQLAQDVASQATDLIRWLNNHGKVHKIFDAAQKQVSKDWLNRELVLAYLVANLTCWTTHSTAFTQLFEVHDALKLAVIQHLSAIVVAQVGVAKSLEARWLNNDAKMHIKIIQDHTFWEGLEQVIGDIEPICYATNINQTNSCCPNSVLRTLAGIYLHFKDHPEPKVASQMTVHVEKWWKGAYQPLFLLCQILNPFESFSQFGDAAGLSHLKCEALLMDVSTGLKVLILSDINMIVFAGVPRG